MHLKEMTGISKTIDQNNNSDQFKNNEPKLQNPLKIKDDLFDLKNKTIGQIKNIIQEKSFEQNTHKYEKHHETLVITSFDQLLKVCNLKKEIKLKYEIEKNVHLVSFENKRIEISFNDDLDKEFIKILSSKLYEWTGDRWIITLSKEKGELSIKEKAVNLKKNSLEHAKKGEVYKKILENFPDAELIDIQIEEKNND